jgi:hypothetical protein
VPSQLPDVLRRLAAWRDTEPSDNPFQLVNTVEGPAEAGEVAAAWPGGVPAGDAAELWRASRTAALFEDSEYGQWGLRLLAPRESAERTGEERGQRPDELRPDDVVVGEFLGDQELLVLAPSEAGSRRVLVALPLDPRAEWYPAADGLAEFLERYYKHHGDKYWERSD